MDKNFQPEELAMYQRFTELKTMYPVRNSERTLGHEAVVLANQQATLVLEMSQYEEATDTYRYYDAREKLLRFRISAELDTVRAHVSDISAHNEQYLDNYLNIESPFTHIATMIKQAEKRAETSLSWKKWLAEQATQDELLTFLQFHNDRIEQQQTDPFIAEQYEIHKSKFIKHVADFVEEGMLMKVPENLDDVVLLIGDIFDMPMQERGGYYEIGKDEINLQQAYFMGPQKRHEELGKIVSFITTHELVHAVIAKSDRDPNNPLGARWINEALTESLATLLDAEWNVFEKRERVYEQERLLFDTLVSRKGDKPTVLRLALRAFSGSEVEQQAFFDYIDEAWGTIHVLEKINDVIDALETYYAGKQQPDRDVQSHAIALVRHKLEKDPQFLFDAYEGKIKVHPDTAAHE